VLLNGFFVATEFAIVKIRPTALKAMVEEGKPGAANALKMVNKLDAYLSATQFGITLASLGLGWVGEPAFVRILEPLVARIVPAQAAQTVTHTVSLAIAFSIITFLHIVLGELAPKSLAIQKAEATSLAVALPMRFFHILFFPGTWLLNGMARRVLSLFGLRTTAEHHDVHSEEELRVILSAASAAGTIGQGRAELLERALAMMEKTVRQVLVPRNQVRFLDLEESIEKNIGEARLMGHTWLPVCRENLDQIEGVVNVKDLFFLLSKGQLKSIAQVQRPVLFVPETATLEQLLTEFRRRRRQFAIVVDEHGGTSGIVSLADVVSEVVGDVAEMGRKQSEVRTLPGGRLELPGSTGLDDLRERLDVTFDVPEDEVTTIGGYLMAKLNRIPRAGDKVPVDEFDVIVEQMDGPRVERVRIQPRLSPAAPAPERSAN
jgi:CBS domain containing-hemolysin-like protein